ncbi:TPA: hypothetical protein ACSP0P_004393, partial [Citrobacter freundii]
EREMEIREIKIVTKRDNLQSIELPGYRLANPSFEQSDIAIRIDSLKVRFFFASTRKILACRSNIARLVARTLYMITNRALSRAA